LPIEQFKTDSFLHHYSKISKPIVADLLKYLELFLQNLDNGFDILSGVVVYETKIS
jgi:hypothetical protein